MRPPSFVVTVCTMAVVVCAAFVAYGMEQLEEAKRVQEDAVFMFIDAQEKMHEAELLRHQAQEAVREAARLHESTKQALEKK